MTAKLSKAFYDRLGENVVTELVDLLNLVDETYRTELREANDRNLERIELLLDKRTTELHARMDQRYAELHARMDQRYAELHARMDQGYAELHARMDRFEAQIAAILPAVDLRLARDGRRNLAWFLTTLIALFGSQLLLAR